MLRSGLYKASFHTGRGAGAGVDKAATYSNLILVAGYAGTFTVWGNTKSQLPEKANISVALLLGLSLSVFVCYQVLKMVGHLRHFASVRNILNLPPSEFFEKWSEFERSIDSKTLRFAPITASICFILCVSLALPALAILFYNFAALLLGVQPWPDTHWPTFPNL